MRLLPQIPHATAPILIVKRTYRRRSPLEAGSGVTRRAGP